MTSKLLINVFEGSVHVEGEEDFVREVYSDFKTLMIEMMKGAPDTKRVSVAPPEEVVPQKAKVKKRTPAKKPSNSSAQVSGINPDNPSLDKNLDTSGIDTFYSQYAPKNHPEKILIFMRFLNDKAEIEDPSTDQIYTCYNAVGEKPAAAFAQSFRDTSSKKFGYIDYNSANDISLTFIGNRHFDHDLKKKGDE